MKIRRLQVGKLRTNCYIVVCDATREAMVIDAGGDVDSILREIAELKCHVRTIVNTHGHADHIAGNKALKEALGCDIAVHELDSSMLTDTSDLVAQYLGLVGEQPEPNRVLHDGAQIEIGEMVFTVIHTPGHSQGSICLYGSGVLFSGDTLFHGSIGRYDLPGGDFSKLKNSLQRLCDLPDDTKVYPGHGPDTSIRREREENPYCQ